MCRRPDAFVTGLLAAALCLLTPAAVPAGEVAGRYGLGRPASPGEIAAWDIDVRPDGHGVKPGRGTVAQGREIYDAQCASCHGIFGESNSFMVIAGGVNRGDLAAGRASGLRQGDVVRTVGNKLNYASTLWDYINRAMPWTNPQSLSVNEVYAVTAYVLHLNDIVGEDFELDERNLLTLPMPNRNGFTTAHGMASRRGRPDVQGTRCMTDCGPSPAVVSEMPQYARNAHGNLAEQNRPLGPFGRIDTTRYEVRRDDAASSRAAPATPPPAAQEAAPSQGRMLFASAGCKACHAVDSRVLGPGMKEVAARYAGSADATDRLAQRIREGGAGSWGQVPMPAQTGLSPLDAVALARWIAAGAP